MIKEGNLIGIFRAALLGSATLLGLAALVPNRAFAGLLGAGNTVQAFYYNGVFAGPEGEDNAATNNSAPASLTVPVSYEEGAADQSTITVGDTQIAITNLAPSGTPFCTENASGTNCPDVIDGFDFLFTGEDILGVTVDPASAPDFLPVTGTFQGNTHLGLQMISPNEIRVDVTGDTPDQDDQLLLDVVTATAPSAPEPAILPLLGGALGFCLLLRRARNRLAGARS
jgi:hypothetical protein